MYTVVLHLPYRFKCFHCALLLVVRWVEGTVFISLTKESPHVSFYVPFVPRQGSLHQPSLTATKVAGFHKSFHPLFIGPEVHHGMLRIYRCYPASVILISAYMWLVMDDGRPPLSVTTAQGKYFYPQYLNSIYKQIIPIGLFVSSHLHKPSTPTVIFESSLQDPLIQNTANFS